MFKDVNVALGVTGSIAAVTTVELIHELRRRGASVRVVMSSSATGIVHPWALEFASESPVITELTGAVEHIELFGEDGWADVFLIAPATANTIGKIAGTIDDTPVTTAATTAIGSDVPIVIAPAMHEPMYDHPGVQDSLDTLGEWDIAVVPPTIEEGKAKIAGEEAILTETARAASASPLADTHVVVTSGATVEPIDPIRILTNRASGKMGRAIAQACYVHGADVTLVHRDGPVPYGSVEQVETASEMTSKTLDRSDAADVVVSAAAVSDYTIEPSSEKLESGQESLTLEFEPTQKLIERVRDRNPSLPIIGFKAESTEYEERLVEQARSLLERVDLEFVVANRTDVMGSDSIEAVIVHPDDEIAFTGSKYELGAVISRSIASL